MANKKIVSLSATAAALAGGTALLNAFVFHEIFGKNAMIPGRIYNGTKKKVPSSIKNKKDERVEWMHAQDFESHNITGSNGSKLQGWFLPAENPSDVFVLGSHGYRSRGRGEFRFISKFYHEQGWNLFLIDHQAAGDSEGKNISFGHFESQDLLLWIDYLREKFGNDIKIILNGVSMGSATVLLASCSEKLLPNVKFIVADCAYTSVADEFAHVLSLVKIPAHPLFDTVAVAGKILGGFDIRKISPLEAVKNAKVPIFFVHGNKDNFVPTKMVYGLFDACPTEKELLIAEKASHGASYRKDSENYEAIIKRFAEKYL